MLRALVLVACVAAVLGCPFINGNVRGRRALPAGHPPVPAMSSFTSTEPPAGYYDALNALDFNAVKADIKAMFKDSKAFWPADYGHYG